jgi:hypothetical protein
MSSELSPQSEQFLANIVAEGVFPSKEAALEAAVDALREKTEQIPMIPEEHEALLEEAFLSDEVGESREMTPEFWEEMRQYARDVAAGKITDDD